MADLENALILRMEASLAKFERQMAKAKASANTTSTAVEKRFDRMSGRVSTSAAQGAAGISRMAQMSGRSRFVLQNTANQLGDIAVQMQTGAGAARVMGQQMPQLLGGFGALGGSLGVIAPLLGTIAAIGIPVGAALFAMGRDSEAAAVMLEKIDALDLSGARNAIANLTELQNRYTEALRVAAATRSSTAVAAVEAIAKEYEAEKALLELRLVQTENQLRAIKELRAAKQEEMTAILEAARAEAEVGFSEIGSGAFNELELRSKAVAQAMLDAANANAQLSGEIKQAAVEETLLELTVNATKAALDEAGDVAAEMNTHIKDGEVSAQGLAAAAGSISFASATGEAQALAAALGVALDTASKLAAMGPQGVSLNPDPSGQVYSGRGGDPRGQGGSLYDWRNRDAITYTPPLVSSKGGGGGGGGGGGAAEIDRQAQAFERLRGQLDPTYAAMQKLGDAQETLNWALENGKISLPEYQALLAQANEEFKTGAQDVAGYVQELGNFMGGFLNDIYQGLRNGEGAWEAFKGAALNALDSIASAALKMAGNAIIQMLFGGGGFGGGGLGGIFGFGGGMPSFAGGGYTGGGARTGGIDGKGGFPAIVHPRETVIDHTKGGGASVTVNISGNLPKGTVRQEGNRIDIDLSQAISSVLGSGGADGAMRGRYGIAPRGI